MGVFTRLFGRRRDEALVPLYTAVVLRGRAEHWYLDGGVADTVDGRFDMIAAILSLVLLRLEEEPAGAEPGARLAEHFVDDMDGQLRELGIGDVMVGKHIGRMMGMLGGRLGAYRDGLASGDLTGALSRNLYRGVMPRPDAIAHVETHMLAMRERMAAMPIATLLAGDLP